MRTLREQIALDAEEYRKMPLARRRACEAELRAALASVVAPEWWWPRY
jgi:hypothetical protein